MALSWYDEDKISELTQQLSESRQQLEDCRKQLALFRSGRAMTALLDEVESLRDANHSLRCRLRDVDAGERLARWKAPGLSHPFATLEYNGMPVHVGLRVPVGEGCARVARINGKS